MLAVAGPIWPEHGIESVIISKSATPGPYAQRLQEAGYFIQYIDPKPEWTFPVRLRQVLKESEVDVLHVHTEHANFWIAAAGRAAGVGRIVRTVHNVFDFEGRLRTERRWQRRILRATGTRTVAVSASVAANEKERFGNPSSVITNWFDSARFRPFSDSQRASARRHLSIPDEQLVISTIGNCGWAKRHELVIESLTALPSNVVYLHLGREDPVQSERRLSIALGVAGRCHFLPGDEDSARVLAASDVFVMPSRREGFSIAALEALACGLRCVFADVPGLQDLKGLGPSIVWVDPDGSGVAQAVLSAAQAPTDPAVSVRVRAEFGVESGVDRYCRIYGAIE
jgi:glycosyltransferase involved in cell wall biosynthesis